MTSTGYSRDHDAVVCQVRRGKTAETLEGDHGKLVLYSLPDGQPVEVAWYRWCDVVELIRASHNARS